MVDVVIPVLSGSDSSHVGYVGFTEVTALLVSNGLPAGEARGWYGFPSRADTVFVGGQWKPYTIDSVAFSLPLLARDTAVDGLVLYVHRVARTIDTLVTFGELDAALTPASLVDSIVVPDTTRSGTLRFVLSGDSLNRVVIPPEDSGHIAIGIRMRANAPSGVRLATLASTAGPAIFTTYARVDVPDTTQQRQTITLAAGQNGYVLDAIRTLDPDLLYIGGLPAARSILRFDIRSEVPDSASILRATLELQPAETLHGLPNDAALLDGRTVLRDVGAKSTPIFDFRAAALLPEGKDTTVAMDIFPLVATWRTSDSLPQVVYLMLSPEAGSFHQPVFFSSRSPSGAPRLRITYLLPAPVERP